MRSLSIPEECSFAVKYAQVWGMKFRSDLRSDDDYESWLKFTEELRRSDINNINVVIEAIKNHELLLIPDSVQVWKIWKLIKSYKFTWALLFDRQGTLIDEHF